MASGMTRRFDPAGRWFLVLEAGRLGIGFCASHK